jgi:hypothetical protein
MNLNEHKNSLIVEFTSLTAFNEFTNSVSNIAVSNVKNSQKQ